MLLFQRNSSYQNAPQCYFIRILSVLLLDFLKVIITANICLAPFTYRKASYTAAYGATLTESQVSVFR